jgi:hypothetical protein
MADAGVTVVTAVTVVTGLTSGRPHDHIRCDVPPWVQTRPGRAS